MKNNLNIAITKIIVCFILWNKILNNKGGEPSQIEKKRGINLSLIIPISDNKIIHIHHWIYLLFFLKRYQKFKYFCIGGILQGLTYSDRLEIIKDITEDTRFFLTKIK